MTRKRFCLALIALLPVTWGGAAFAETIEEIIVIAQKREQPLQDVGISITAFTAEQLRQLGMFTSDELARQTPGLQASSFSGDPTVMLFAIRGVGQNDFTDHHEGPTAVYVDEAYVSALGAVGFQMFDLERAEVLRGPQGTLFGRNATGGLVHFITAKPTQELDGFINVTAGDFSLLRLEGAIGGPLGDSFAGRVAVVSHSADGYLENRVGPDVHEVKQTAVRAQLAYESGRGFNALLKLYTAQDDNPDVGGFHQLASIPGTDGLGEYLPLDVNADYFGLGSCPGCDPLGYRDDDGDAWAGEFDTTGRFDRDAVGGTLTLNWMPGDLTVTSISDWLDLDKSYGEDSDGSPNPLALFETDQDSQQFSQEVRVMGGGDALPWTAGIYYLDIDGDYSNVFASPLFDASQVNTYAQSTQSIAIFGQVELPFADHWRLVAGLRWTDEEKDFSYDPQCFGTGCLGFFVFPGSGTVSDIGGFNAATVGDLTTLDDSTWSGKLQVEWSNGDTMAYGGINRGHKAGGFNAPLDGLLLPEEMQYDKEVLTSYEIGFKTGWSDRAYGLNGSVFYYDYDDKQAFTFSGFTTYLLNRPSEVYGMELEFIARPSETFDFTLGVATLDATVDDVPLPSGRLAKQEMAQAPDLTVNTMLRKGWQVGESLLTVIVDGSYVSEQFYNTINHATAKADAYSLWNARLVYTGSSGNWSLAAFVNNLADEEAATYAIDVSAFGYSLLSYAPPRWFGVQFDYRL